MGLMSNMWVKLAASLLIPLAAGVIGSIYTAPNIESWYNGLVKPALTPPNTIFAPVWTTLYIMMGIALFLVWRRGTHFPQVGAGLAIFALQMGLNTLWSLAFFGMRNPLAGVIVIILLWLAIAATIAQFWRVSRWAGLFLVPYLCWVSFAAYLNISVWWLN